MTKQRDQKPSSHLPEMSQREFETALYYAVREAFNNQHVDDTHIDANPKIDALIRKAISFVESRNAKIPFVWSMVECDALAGCSRRRRNAMQPRLIDLRLREQEQVQ